MGFLKDKIEMSRAGEENGSEMEKKEDNEYRWKKKHTCMCVFFVSSILFVLGVWLSRPAMEDLYRKMLKKNIILSKGSVAYNNWAHTDLPVIHRLYVFNYTNLEDMKKGEKPIINQLGPYAYREDRWNHVVDYNKYELTYFTNYSYKPYPEFSCATCHENDTVYVPYFTMFIIAKMLHNLNITEDSGYFKRLEMKAVNTYLETTSASLFIKLTVKQLFWGYDDPILETITKLKPLLSILGVKIPKFDPVVMMMRNGSIEADYIGNITVKTGYEDVDDILKVTKWRGKSEIPMWKTKYGRMLNGTDGTHTKTSLKKDDRFYMFAPDACRTIYLEYDKEVTHYGLKLFRFTTPRSLWASYKENPDNEAFCDPDRCYASGVFPVGPCADGDVPLFLSLPHFYNGDPKLVNAITGLKPNKTLHNIFIDVEPTTGSALVAKVRFQLSMMAQKTPFIKMTEYLREEDNYFPSIYFYTEASVNKKLTEDIKFGIFTTRTIIYNTQYAMIACGCLIALVIAILFAIRFYRMRKRETEDTSFKKFENEE